MGWKENLRGFYGKHENGVGAEKLEIMRANVAAVEASIHQALWAVQKEMQANGRNVDLEPVRVQWGGEWLLVGENITVHYGTTLELRCTVEIDGASVLLTTHDPRPVPRHEIGPTHMRLDDVAQAVTQHYMSTLEGR